MRIRLDSRGQALKRTILGHREHYDQTLTAKKEVINEESSRGNIMRARLAQKFKQCALRSPVKMTNFGNSMTLQKTLTSIKKLE